MLRRASSLRSATLPRTRSSAAVFTAHVRNLNIHEYQSAALMES
jgi:hypothetical protein